jgi:hypothetical protein
MRARNAGVVGLLATAALVTGCGSTPPTLPARVATTAPTAAPSEAPAASADLVLTDPRIGESSGLAASTMHPGVLYTHNDQGHDTEVFAVGTEGDTRAVLDLPGANAVDLEDIAVTPDGRIWLADTGDNEQRRSSVSVFVTDEPAALADASLSWTQYRFRYEDGSRNAEALLVHPQTQQVYVVSKEGRAGSIYAAPESPSTEEVNVLRKVADSPANITAGAFSPDGTRLAMRNYANAFVYTDIGTSPWVLRVPDSRQGESLTFALDGSAILVGSEGVRSPVHTVWLPRSLAAPPTEEGTS